MIPTIRSRPSTVFPLLLWIFFAAAAERVRGQATPAQETPGQGGSQAVLSLLPGVDGQRLRETEGVWSDPPSPEGIAASAKLLWALGRLDRTTLDSLARQPARGDASDAARVRVAERQGKVQRYDAVSLPVELADVLEFDRLYRVEVQPDRGGEAADATAPTLRVVTRHIPAAWGADGGVGQLVRFTAVEVGEGASRRLFADRFRWYPVTGEKVPAGWAMLAAAGVDIHALSEVASRNRQPLRPEDQEAFYGMLAAAAEIDEDRRPAARPDRVDALEMLRNPTDAVGRWIRFDATMARISRVVVTSPEARQMLGRDSYWQVDAFASLGDTRVELEASRETGEPLVFENRFPVTVAILELPEWLTQRIAGADGAGRGGRVDMQMVSGDVTVDGFFYRLWSYESEFTESRGARQVGPLVLAADIRPRISDAVSEASVAWIGWIFAAVIVGALLIAAGALWRIERRDRQIARQRRHMPVRLPAEDDRPQA